MPMPMFAKTVASITAKLKKTIDELEAHAEDQAYQVERKAALIATMTAEKVEHSREFELAKKVADNIRAMLGGGSDVMDL